MYTVKIKLNGVKLPHGCFCAGADICPSISIDYTHWPEFVVVSGIDDVTQYVIHMYNIFSECNPERASEVVIQILE